MRLPAISRRDQGTRLPAIPCRDQQMRPILRRDHSRRTTRQNSRELRNITQFTSITDTMTIRRNTSITYITLIPSDMNLTRWRT